VSTKNCRKEPSETGNLGETARADGRYMYTKGTLPRYLFFFFVLEGDTLKSRYMKEKAEDLVSVVRSRH
jgi:hypothetical protein